MECKFKMEGGACTAGFDHALGMCFMKQATGCGDGLLDLIDSVGGV